jgi:putative ATP-binding cassette transporter
MLSLGEQQRLGLARALLLKPQYLFLDEATASLDEPSEAALYRLIEEKLPATTIVSIGHRSTLEPFHQRQIVMSRDGDRFALQNRSETSAPAA